MSEPRLDPNATTNFSKNTKKPNFLGIVIGSAIFLLVALVVAWFVVHSDGNKLMPHPANPTPNSLSQPLLPNNSANVAA